MDKETTAQKMSDMKSDTDTYISIMHDIIRRTGIIEALLIEKIDMMDNDIQAETVALQVRMIIESIALASLSVNKSLFEQEGDKFKEFWKVDLIFRDIENKNPNFYPQPVKLYDSNIPNVSKVVNIETGFMTRSEMIKIHTKCCDLLHAKNPYGKSRDHKDFLVQVPGWIRLIVKLLKTHLIQLLNENELYLVHIHDTDKKNMHVKMMYAVHNDDKYDIKTLTKT